MEFELDSKIVVDSLYGSKIGVSNYNAVINDCKRQLASDLVRFIWRQADKTAHCFAKVASCHASFHIHIRISSYISIIIMNEIQ